MARTRYTWRMQNVEVGKAYRVDQGRVWLVTEVRAGRRVVPPGPQPHGGRRLLHRGRRHGQRRRHGHVRADLPPRRLSAEDGLRPVTRQPGSKPGRRTGGTAMRRGAVAQRESKQPYQLPDGGSTPLRSTTHPAPGVTHAGPPADGLAANGSLSTGRAEQPLNITSTKLLRTRATHARLRSRGTR